MERKIIKINDFFLEGKRPYLWIFLIGFLVYFRSLFFGYTYLDDNVLILDNFSFISRLSNILRTFSLEVFHVAHASAAYYRPLLTVSFMLDAQLGGKAPFFYHLDNIAIHIIATCLLFSFLTKIGTKRKLAFFFSLVFAVLPALVQAVAWIPGRNDSLLALFFLGAFILFIDYLEKGKGKYLYWHGFFFALALFTKESTILFPLVAVLYIWLIRKEKIFDIPKLKLFFVWGGIGIAWFLLRANALKNPISYSVQDIAKSLFLNMQATLLYLGKALFPVNLSVLPTLQDSTLNYGLLAIGLIATALILSKNKRYGYIIFGAFWYLMFLLPSFIRPNAQYVADFIEHRAYLPFVGLIIVFGEIDFIKNLRLEKKIIFLLGATYIVLLSFVTTAYSRNFRNGIIFWQNAVKNSPSHPLAHKNLGAMYYLDGKISEAEVEYKAALEIYPYETMVHNNLGLIYMNKKDFTDAEKEFKKELEINPDYDNAYFNYGLLLYSTKRYDEAEKAWLKTLEINPDYLDAYNSLTVLYDQEGKTDKANLYYQEGLKRARGL